MPAFFSANAAAPSAPLSFLSFLSFFPFLSLLSHQSPRWVLLDKLNTRLRTKLVSTHSSLQGPQREQHHAAQPANQCFSIAAEDSGGGSAGGASLRGFILRYPLLALPLPAAAALCRGS